MVGRRGPARATQRPASAEAAIMAIAMGTNTTAVR